MRYSDILFDNRRF